MLPDIDLFVTRWINTPAGHRPFLDALMIGATEIVIPIMVLAVGARWWSRVDRESERKLVIEAGLTFLIGLLINQAVLLFVSRVRPYDTGISHLIIAPSSDPSFPSDHATGAIAIVATMWLNNYSRRAMLFAAPVALLLLSRVYVGTHYVSDVIGGSGTALAAATIIRATARVRAPITARLVRIF